MTKPSSNHSVDTTQIVPKGYWTFWCVLSLLGGIGGVVAGVLVGRGLGLIIGVASLISGVAGSVVYWRVKRGK